MVTMSNKEIRSQIGLHVSLDAMILKQKLTYFGHVMRGKGLKNSIMLGMVGGARGRGRPRRRWLDEVVETTGLNIWEVQEATRDRCGWRRFVMEVARDRKRPDGTR